MAPVRFWHAVVATVSRGRLYTQEHAYISLLFGARRKRQAAITTELTEIIAGASALTDQ